MKKITHFILLFATILFMGGCDKNFEEINTNPQQVTSVDPGFLFSNALLNTSVSNWSAESTIAQQFVLPYNLGTTLGYQFNENVDGLNNGPWGAYTASVKYLEHIISLVKSDASRSNLYNQARIWRAYNYMWLVDHYGDVPYADAGKGFLESNYTPKYDKDKVIYDDLHKELKEATAALNPGGDNNSRFDIFIPSSSTAAIEVTYWKKLGYSLMLRLGMRYSKVDPTKAKSIVQEAFSGGVMQSNSDNVYIKNMTATGGAIAGYTHALNNSIRVNNPFNYYLAEPFINQLKSTSDPRLKYIAARYTPSQSTAPSVANPDTTTADQYGFPIGYSDATLKNYPGYRPPVGTGQDYSQINFNVVGNQTAPELLITNAQTKLLLAEAAYKGWLNGLPGAKTAPEYYEDGVRASMDAYTLFPNTRPISLAEENQYLAQPGVQYNNTDALKLINTEYWTESFNNGYEAWSNFRRSGFPTLSPNMFNNNLNGGFIRRFAYPLREVSINPENYKSAVASIGGKDDLVTRVFWDTP